MIIRDETDHEEEQGAGGGGAGLFVSMLLEYMTQVPPS